MPDYKVSAYLNEDVPIIATLDKKPYKGIQALIEKVYLINPDAVNALIEQINEAIEEIMKHTDSTFVFEFDSSQSVWVIEHNLNKDPSITVVDSANNVVGCKRSYINENSVEIEFNAPFNGKAYLN